MFSFRNIGSSIWYHWPTSSKYFTFYNRLYIRHLLGAPERTDATDSRRTTLHSERNLARSEALRWIKCARLNSLFLREVTSTIYLLCYVTSLQTPSFLEWTTTITSSRWPSAACATPRVTRRQALGGQNNIAERSWTARGPSTSRPDNSQFTGHDTVHSSIVLPYYEMPSSCQAIYHLSIWIVRYKQNVLTSLLQLGLNAEVKFYYEVIIEK